MKCFLDDYKDYYVWPTAPVSLETLIALSENEDGYLENDEIVGMWMFASGFRSIPEKIGPREYDPATNTMQMYKQTIVMSAHAKPYMAKWSGEVPPFHTLRAKLLMRGIAIYTLREFNYRELISLGLTKRQARHAAGLGGKTKSTYV